MRLTPPVSDADRPNPDALLSFIQREESARRRGKLKIFLGMAPGVGKTYAMLEAAQRETFLLYQEGELSVEEIAEATGVGFEAAKSRLRYAVAKLRELLQAEHGREVA